MAFHGHDMNHYPSIMSIHIEDQLLFIIIDISYTSIDRKQQRSVQLMYKYNLQTAHKSQKKSYPTRITIMFRRKNKRRQAMPYHIFCAGTSP